MSRRVLAAAALALVIPLLVVAPAGGRVRPGQEPPAGGDLDVVAQTPFVARDGAFHLVLDVRGAPVGARIEAQLHDRAPDLEAFHRSTFGADLGEELPRVAPVELDDVPSRAGVRRLIITIDLDRGSTGEPGDLGLSRGLGGPGAYPLAVRLVADDGSPLASIVTHLVRLPTDQAQVEPLRVALVLPVHVDPTVRPEGPADPIGEEALDGVEAVATSLAGRPEVPVTVAATPQTIEAMTRQGGRATELVEDLRTALPGRQLLAAPYVDVPLAGWVEHGLLGELARQRDRGTAVLTDRLVRPDGRTLLVDGPLTPATVRTLREAGVDQVVAAPGTGLRAPSPVGDGAPVAPFPVATGLATTLTAVTPTAGATLAQEGAPVLRAHQVLAELAVTWQYRADGQGRGGVAVVPDRHWVADLRLVPLLEGLLAGSRILRPVTVAGLAEEVPEVGIPQQPGGEAPDLRRYAEALHEERGRVASLRTMLRTGDPLPDDLEERLDVSGASSFEPGERLAYLAAVRDRIDKRAGVVDAPGDQTVTLTARDAKLPLVLRNRLERPVDVEVHLDAGTRLEFPDGAVMPLRLQPGQQRLQIPVRTRSPGTSPVAVRITSPDGGLLLGRTSYTVRSTAVSGVGAALSIGALVLLLAWWLRHVLRSRRDRRAGAAG